MEAIVTLYCAKLVELKPCFPEFFPLFVSRSGLASREIFMRFERQKSKSSCSML